MTRTRLAIGALLAIILLGGALAATARRHRRTAAASAIPAELRAPEGVRIRVQVLNATKTRGLARRATLLLRDRGFDVVETGTINETRDSTLIIDLTGHPDWAKRIAALMGSATVEARPDSSRYLDIAVILGSTWRPPAVPFYP